MADSGTIRHVITDGRVIDEALRRAAVAARREYVRAGLSVPVWRGGRLVWIEPAELKQYEADGHAATGGDEDTNDKRAV
jgi:hypothetical protein